MTWKSWSPGDKHFKSFLVSVLWLIAVFQIATGFVAMITQWWYHTAQEWVLWLPLCIFPPAQHQKKPTLALQPTVPFRVWASFIIFVPLWSKHNCKNETQKNSQREPWDLTARSHAPWWLGQGLKYTYDDLHVGILKSIYWHIYVSHKGPSVIRVQLDEFHKVWNSHITNIQIKKQHNQQPRTSPVSPCSHYLSALQRTPSPDF